MERMYILLKPRTTHTKKTGEARLGVCKAVVLNLPVTGPLVSNNPIIGAT